MNRFLQFPQEEGQAFKRRIPVIHKKANNSQLSRSVEKSPQIRSYNSCETEIAIKKRSAFDIRVKTNEKASSRYSPLGQKAHDIIKNRSKNIGVITQLFTTIKKDRDKSVESNKSIPAKKSISDLKEQLLNLTSSKNQMIPSSLKKSNSKPKSKARSNSNSSNRLVEVTHKEMKDYSEFIMAKNESYYTRINYNFLRQCDKVNALSLIDLKEYYLIESVNLCLIDAFRDCKYTNQKLVQEYCSIFLKSQERKKLQVFLNFHFFKTFAPKIRNLFTYQRIFYFITYKVAERKLNFNKAISQILFAAFEAINLSLKSVLEAVRELTGKNSSNIMETFRSLKTVKELQTYIEKLQKKFIQLENQIESLQASIDVQLFKSQVQQIQGNLRPFLGQTNFYHKVEEFQARSETILNWKLIRIPPVPYLPQKLAHSPKYTLVLGLNQVLINYNPTNKILKYRAFMDTFLQRVKDKFEIVIFSEFDKELTDRIVKQIERSHSFFDFRLYNTHNKFKRGKMVKDLASIGRNLQHLIYLDNQSESTEQIMENWMKIPPYKPVAKLSQTHKDNTLLNILKDLLLILEKEPADIRSYLTSPNLARIPEASSLEEKSLSISNKSQIYHY